MVSFLVGVAQLDITDDFEITPLFVAAQYGQRRCLELLAEAGMEAFGTQGGEMGAASATFNTPQSSFWMEAHTKCGLVFWGIIRGAAASVG